jgi:hypothetical protein
MQNLKYCSLGRKTLAPTKFSDHTIFYHCQLIPPVANGFHRLPTGANRAVSRSAAVGGLATSGIGWQPMDSVGN